MTPQLDRRDLYKSVSEVLAKDGKESLALRFDQEHWISLTWISLHTAIFCLFLSNAHPVFLPKIPPHWPHFLRSSFLLYLSIFLSFLHRFLIKYLGTHSGEVYPTAVQELATTAVLSAIKSPVSAFSDRNALLEVGEVVLFFCFVLSHHPGLCPACPVYCYLSCWVWWHSTIAVCKCRVNVCWSYAP